jgi:nitrogen fixation NifU-like protein
MLDLRDLYQEVIVDHNRSPRNFGELDNASRSAEGYNPLCGDRLNLYLAIDGDTITDARFHGSGCAISVASASLMTEALKGKKLAQAEALFNDFHRLLTDKAGPQDTESLGKLAVLAGVREYPTRIKCATLCWHTLRSALKGDTQPVSTE